MGGGDFRYFDLNGPLKLGQSSGVSTLGLTNKQENTNFEGNKTPEKIAKIANQVCL